MQLDIVMVQEFQLEKEMFFIIQLLIRFWKKIGSSKSENKRVIGSPSIIFDIVDEYNIQFLDDPGHIRMKPKGTSWN